MGRIARELFKSATRLGPLDVLTTGLDYSQGKDEGEDDIRAGVGAVGSTLGGWKGALAGAGAGSAFGPVGTVVGGIIGGTAGGFLGGWGADRADDLIRGNKNKQRDKDNSMATFSSGYGNYFDEERARREEEERIYRERGYGLGDLATHLGTAGAVGTGVYGVAKSAKQTNFVNPFALADDLVQSGISRGSARQIAGQTLKSQAGNFARNMPLVGKAAIGIGAAKLLDDATGGNVQRGLAGAFDAVTGNILDLDARGDGKSDAQRMEEKQAEEQKKYQQFLDKENERRINALPSNNPYLTAMQGINEAAQDKLLRRADLEYERGFRDRQYVAERATQIGRENFLTETQAKQARELMNAYARDIPFAVTNQLNGIFSARYT
jgi:hypothetical protein